MTDINIIESETVINELYKDLQNKNDKLYINNDDKIILTNIVYNETDSSYNTIIKLSAPDDPDERTTLLKTQSNERVKNQFYLNNPFKDGSRSIDVEQLEPQYHIIPPTKKTETCTVDIPLPKLWLKKKVGTDTNKYELNYGVHWYVDFETGFIYLNNKGTTIYNTQTQVPLFAEENTEENIEYNFNTTDVISDSDIYDLIFEGYIFKKDLEIYDKETNNVINIKNTITLPLINKVYIGDIRDTETNIRYIETPSLNGANSIDRATIEELNNSDLRSTFIESIRQAENTDNMYQIRVKNNKDKTDVFKLRARLFMEIPSTATEEENTSILKEDNLFMKATVYHNNGNIVKQEGLVDFITINKDKPIQDVELKLDEAKIEPGESTILNVRIQNNTEVLNGFDYRFFYTQTETFQQPFKITVNPNSLGGGYLEDEYITDPNFGGSIRLALKGINIITQEDNKDASTYDLSRIYLIFNDRIGFNKNILDHSSNRWETEDGVTKLNDIFSSGTNKRQRENIINQFTGRFDSDKVPINDVRMIDDKMKHRTLFDNIVTKYNKNLAKFSNLPEYRYGHTATYVSNINSDVIENTDEPTTDPNYISQIWIIGGYKMDPSTVTIDTEIPTNEILVLNTSSNVWEKKVVRNRLKIYDIIEHDDENNLICIVENDKDFEIDQDINLYEANGIDIMKYDDDSNVNIKIKKKFIESTYIHLQVLKLENVRKKKLNSDLDPNKILDYTIDETFYKFNIVNIVTKENNYTVKIFNQYLNEMKQNALLYRETPDDMNEGTLSGDGNKYLITYDNYENEPQHIEAAIFNSIHGILKKINIIINDETHTFLISHGGFNDRDASFNTNIYYNELKEFELSVYQKLNNDTANDISNIAYHDVVFLEDNMYVFGGIKKYLYDTSFVSDISNSFINNINNQNISKIDYLNIKKMVDENGEILWKKKDIIITSKISSTDISNLLIFGHTTNKYRDNYVNPITNKKNDYIGILGGITSTTEQAVKKKYYGTYNDLYEIDKNNYDTNNLTKMLLVNISSTVWLWDLRYIRSRNDRNITIPNLIFHSSIIYYDKLRKREFMIIYGGIIVDINNDTANLNSNQLAKFKNNMTIGNITRTEINGNIYKIDLLTVKEKDTNGVEREFYEFEIIDQASNNVDDGELWKHRFNHSAILNGYSMVVSGGSQVSLNIDDDEVIEKKINDIRVFDLINNRWVDEVFLTLGQDEQHENVKLIQHKNYLFATYRSYITGSNDNDPSNNLIKIKQQINIHDADLDFNTDTETGFYVIIKDKTQIIKEYYPMELINFDKECELYAQFPNIAHHTSNYIELLNTNTDLLERYIYIFGGEKRSSNILDDKYYKIMRINIDNNEWKRVSVDAINITDDFKRPIDFNISKGHTSTYMEFDSIYNDKPIEAILIIGGVNYSNNLYVYYYTNSSMDFYNINTDVNTLDINNSDISFSISNHTATWIENKQSSEFWSFKGLLITGGKQNGEIGKNIYILDYSLNAADEIEYTIREISDPLNLNIDSSFQNHTAVYLNTATDLKEPYGKVILTGGKKLDGSYNETIYIIDLSNIEKPDDETDLSYNKIFKSSIRKYSKTDNTLMEFYDDENEYNNFQYSEYHQTIVDDENNIWIIGGSNNLFEASLNTLIVTGNENTATIRADKQFVTIFRQPSKVPLIDEVLIIDLSYNALRNDIEEKDVIIKYKPQKPPKLAGFAITWTSVNFSDALKNIPQWATNDYLGNYKALSQYWCKKWNNNNYFHFNSDFVPTLYIENNESELFLNKIYLNFDKCDPNKESDKRGQDLSFIRMSDILEAASAAMRQSNLKGKKGEPNFADGQPGPNGKDKDFNVYYMEDITGTLKRYSNAVKFDLDLHNAGSKAPWYPGTSGELWANTYKEWDEVEELVKIYLTEYEKVNIPDTEPTSYFNYYYYLRDNWDRYVSKNLWAYWWKNPKEIKTLTDTGMDEEEARRRVNGEIRYIIPGTRGNKGVKGMIGAQGITSMIYGKDKVEQLTNIPEKIEESTEYKNFKSLTMIICDNIRIPSNLYVRGTEKTETTEKGGVFLLSDARLKKDIENINTDKAVRIIENLEPVAYSIMDRSSLTYFPEYGYIAQDVKKHFPQAVTENNRNVVENIGRFSEKNIWERFENEKGEIQYKLTIDLSENEIPDDEEKEYKMICIKRLDENITDEMHKNNIEKLKAVDFNTDKSVILDNYIVDELDLILLKDNRSFIVDKKYDEIYIYGYKVNDFHVLDKDKIFTLHHTVLKKLHEESVKMEVMNAKSLEKQYIQNMKEETTNIRKKIDDMKKMINNLMI